MSEQAAAGVRVNVYGHGEATVETGLPVLNQLLARHEPNLHWRDGDESFDATSRLEDTGGRPRSDKH